MHGTDSNGNGESDNFTVISPRFRTLLLYIDSYQSPGHSCEVIFEQSNNSEGNKSGEFWISKDKNGPRKVVCSIGGKRMKRWA